MMRYDLYANLGSLLDISHYGVKSSIAFRPFPQHDVICVHSYCFEDKVSLIAIVFHPLQFIEIPCGLRAQTDAVEVTVPGAGTLGAG